MTRLLLAITAAAGWLAALVAVWNVGRAYEEGFEEAYEEGFSDGERQAVGA